MAKDNSKTKSKARARARLSADDRTIEEIARDLERHNLQLVKPEPGMRTLFDVVGEEGLDEQRKRFLRAQNRAKGRKPRGPV